MGCAVGLTRVAEHRPATRARRFRHDDLIAVDLFSGFGGLTLGIKRAGITTIACANHDIYKVEVHEANHPEAEHWIADMVDSESPAYHSARDLPAADVVAAGVSCVNHSPANTKKAYAQGLSLFDLDDPEFDERVTRSERDRATANCVLHYAQQHHPRVALIECTTELTSWGPALPTNPRIGDGSTFRWWLKAWGLEGYKYRILYLNSQFFGVPQSRDRLYIVFWDKRIPDPDLDHRPESWCGACDEVVQAQWVWKTGVPPSGSVRYGRQYRYVCPRCRGEVVPPITPSLAALDLTDLGKRIGDRPIRTFKDGSSGPLAAATMARAERCRQRFGEFPAVVMPGEFGGAETHPWRSSAGESGVVSTGAIMQMANGFEHPGSQCRTRDLGEPLWTQPASNTTGLLTPAIALGVNNFQGAPRGVDEALPTQGGSETLGLMSARIMPNRTNATSRAVQEPMETVVAGAGSGGLGVLSSGVIPFRKNTRPTTHAESMPTVTAEQIPGVLTAAGLIKNNGSIGEAKYRAYPVSGSLGTIVGSAASQGLLTSGWAGAAGVVDLQAWRDALADLRLEDCYFRMMFAHEVGRGCGFNVDFGDHKGDFVVWGSAKDQVDGYGNAVSPSVGEWIGLRLRAVLHGMAA